MARIRTIKPTIWTDADFVECSTNARLLFVAALNFASDYGVMADKPIELKMQCFPGDSVDMEPLIDELVKHRLWVRRVAPDGAKVLVIRTFQSHQKVDRPNDGRWGNPDEWPQFDEPSSNHRRSIDDQSPPEGKGREGNRTCPDDLDEFNQFWAQYPKREAKKTAQAAFAKARKEATLEQILKALAPIKAKWANPRERQYVPLAASWLNAGRWMDETTTPEASILTLNGARMSREAMMRQ